MARPDRPPGRDAGGGPPAQGNRLHMTTPPLPDAEAVNILRPGADGPRICWRCGTPFAWTDAAALARCAELASEAAVEERTAAGLCPACAAGLAS